MKGWIWGFLLVFGLLRPAVASDIFAANKALGAGVNFGNALEAPNEGEWGVTLEASFFDAVKAAGFKHIRLPVSWTNHAAKAPPYTVDPVWFRRVDWAIEQATRRGLKVVLNIHHYDELNDNPTAETPRYLAIWRQIAQRYRAQPGSLYFELLNEPHGVLNEANLWNDLLRKALAVIRATNPTRPVVVGPMGWNSVWSLAKLNLPSDPNLIVTVHFYDPMRFTHQGADWVGRAMPSGVDWRPNGAELATGWQDWSWDTGLRFVGGALELSYNKGWAGFDLHSEIPLSGYTQLAFRTSATLSLQVLCKRDAPTKTLTSLAGQETTVALSECGNPNLLTDFFLQNNTPDAQKAFQIDLLELRGPGKTFKLISSAQALISDTFDVAVAWAKQNNRPLYLGEFGTYEKADLASRVRWTQAVRSEAKKRGFSWAYWEFGAGFGIYDRAAKAWRTPLLRALIP